MAESYAAAGHAKSHPALQHHFENMEQQREASTLGMWVFLVTEIMFFGGMLLVYLPKEKILVNADMYTPPAAGAPAPPLNDNMRSLQQNIQRLKLDVAQHVPIHGQPGTGAQFTQIAGRGTN